MNVWPRLDDSPTVNAPSIRVSDVDTHRDAEGSGRRALADHLTTLSERIASTPDPPGGPGSPLSRLHNRQRQVLNRIVTDLRSRLDDDGKVGSTELSPAIRAVYGLVAGFQGAAEWHSPPLRATMPGDRDPNSAATDHDYRRDRCPVVTAFEEAWLRECVSSNGDPGRKGLRALAFANGMAAIGTVTTMLSAETSSFIVPDSVYHETRFLLANGPARAKVRWLAADDIPTHGNPDGARRLAAELAGAEDAPVIVVDGQANGPGLEIVDWPALIDVVKRHRPRSTIMIDVTVSSVGFRPFEQERHHGPRLITVESLTKTAQLGQDRVAGGIVITDTDTATAIDRWREHLGTIAVAATIRQLPRPSTDAMASRLRRQQANARLLADELRNDLCRHDLSVVHRHVPLTRRSAPGEPDTLGTLVVMTGWSLRRLELLMGRIVTGAVEFQIPLAQGTSFGFDTTRLALIVPDPACAVSSIREPEHGAVAYLRIAAGTGGPAEMRAISRLIADAVAADGWRHPSVDFSPPGPFDPTIGALDADS